jgi:phosphoribosylformylglycinamidine synthase
VAVGADPSRIALLDNFCWANTDRPEVLGSLVRAAEACRDMALAFDLPFISGKDSLNNEFHAGDRHILIPPTLLISALGLVHDVLRCVTMDWKGPDHILYLVGITCDEMGGSHFNLITNQKGGKVPGVDPATARRIFYKVHEAVQLGLLCSCHDLSEGGLAVALAEMAFSGGFGADITRLPGQATEDDVVRLFAESNSRFILEVVPEKTAAVERLFQDLPLFRIGTTCQEPRLQIGSKPGQPLISLSLTQLKEAWQQPLRW